MARYFVLPRWGLGLGYPQYPSGFRSPAFAGSQNHWLTSLGATRLQLAVLRLNLLIPSILNQPAQLGQVFRYRLVGIFTTLVLKGDIAAVFGPLENLDDPSKVGRLLLAVNRNVYL